MTGPSDILTVQAEIDAAPSVPRGKPGDLQLVKLVGNKYPVPKRTVSLRILLEALGTLCYSDLLVQFRRTWV